MHHKAPQAHPPRPRSRAIKPQNHRRKRVEYAPGRVGFDAAYLLFVQDFRFFSLAGSNLAKNASVSRSRSYLNIAA